MDGIAASRDFRLLQRARLAFLGEYPTQFGSLVGVSARHVAGRDWVGLAVMGDVGRAISGYVLGFMGLFSVREERFSFPRMPVAHAPVKKP
jgi:hypothetical protein